MLLEFDTKGGFFVKSKDFVKVNRQVEDIFNQSLTGSDYQANIKDFLSEFDTVDKVNESFHNQTNDISLKGLSKEFAQIKEVVINETQKALYTINIDQATVQLLKDTLRNNVYLGASIGQTREFLRQEILGGNGSVGILERHVTQVTRDSLYGYDGMVQSIIADKFDMPYYAYLGSLKEDSRPQCVRWVKERFLQRSTLEKEIEWADNEGSGMRKGTTPENFAIYRGGWNCRHQARPVFKPLAKNMPKK